MVIDLKQKSDVVLIAEDSSKEENQVLVYKLTNLDSYICDVDSSEFYIAVPNGGNAILNNVPEGSYFVEKMNK